MDTDTHTPARSHRKRIKHHIVVILVLGILVAPGAARASVWSFIFDQIVGWGSGQVIDAILDGSMGRDVSQSRAYVTQIIERPPPDVDLTEVRQYAEELERLDGLITSLRVARNTSRRLEMAAAIKQLALDMVDLERRVSRLELRVSRLEGQVDQNTADIHQIRTDYDTLLEEQLLRRPLCEGSGAFLSQMFFPWRNGGPPRLGAGAQFKFIFQGKHVFGGAGYSFQHLENAESLEDAGWVHFVFGQIGAQYHWSYVTLTGAVRTGYRFVSRDMPIAPVAMGLAFGLKLYPHHNVPLELEINAMQSDRDTSIGAALGIGTRGEWVAIGVGVATLVVLGIAGGQGSR